MIIIANVNESADNDTKVGELGIPPIRIDNTDPDGITKTTENNDNNNENNNENNNSNKDNN
eukprot:Pgem_evm1s9889